MPIQTVAMKSLMIEVNCEKRILMDRRNYSPHWHIPERRKGKDRRESDNLANVQAT